MPYAIRTAHRIVRVLVVVDREHGDQHIEARLVESVHLQMGESKSLCRVLATNAGRKIPAIVGLKPCESPRSYLGNGIPQRV